MKPCTVNDNAQDDESPKQDVSARIEPSPAQRHTETDSGVDVVRDIHFLKGYTVFNVEQIEGLAAQYTAPASPRVDVSARIARAECFFGDRCHARPRRQPCLLPALDRQHRPAALRDPLASSRQRSRKRCSSVSPQTPGTRHGSLFSHRCTPERTLPWQRQWDFYVRAESRSHRRGVAKGDSAHSFTGVFAEWPCSPCNPFPRLEGNVPRRLEFDYGIRREPHFTHS